MIECKYSINRYTQSHGKYNTESCYEYKKRKAASFGRAAELGR